jgi:hypothetical protein
MLAGPGEHDPAQGRRLRAYRSAVYKRFTLTSLLSRPLRIALSKVSHSRARPDRRSPRRNLRSPCQICRCCPGTQLSLRHPFCVNDVGNGRNRSLDGANRANIPASPYGLGELKEWKRSKLAHGSGHGLPLGRSSPAEQCQMEAARSPGKKTVRKKAAAKKASSPWGKWSPVRSRLWWSSVM